MARNLGVSYTENKPYYFISYNSEDEIQVAAFARELEKFGIPMWYDHGIKLGTEWENEIAERIDTCEAVIMFLSKNIFVKENSYVHKEFELATEYSEKTVYVVMLDEIKKPEVPVRFRGWWTEVTRLQCVNAFQYASENECIRVLLDGAGIKKSEQPYVKEPELVIDAHEKIETINFKSGGVYKGEVKDKKRHGKGKMVWADGSVYEGDWLNGKRTGKGKMVWGADTEWSGDVYEGDFVNGKRHGKGRYAWADGNVYEGDWVNGNRTGKGKFSWEDGDVYEGDFVNNVRTGKGKFSWADGDFYEGDFVDGEIRGKGKMIWAYGDSYEGDWENGLMHGKGKYTWLDGTVYEGDFEKDKFSGYGKKTFNDGRVEKGRFENDKFIG